MAQTIGMVYLSPKQINMTAEGPGCDLGNLKKDFNALLNLQIITEKLLFQMEIPPEISQKYTTLKDGTYAAIGINVDDPFTFVNSLVQEKVQRISPV